MITRKIIILYTSSIALLGLFLWYGPFFSIGKVCRKSDRYVDEVNGRIQEYLAKNGKFFLENQIVDTNDYSKQQVDLMNQLKRSYPIDTFSVTGEGEIFVYFKSNCKLQVKKASYEVYPRR